MVAPAAASKNFARLTASGREGPSVGTRRSTTRLRACPKARSYVVVHSYMAHHQAMTIIGIADVIHDGRIRQRFHAEPMVQATELLLQERMPRDVSVARPPPELKTGAVVLYQSVAADPAPLHDCAHPHPAHPSDVQRNYARDDHGGRFRLQPLGGFRRHALARGFTRDSWGSFIFLRDARTGAAGPPAINLAGPSRTITKPSSPKAAV